MTLKAVVIGCGRMGERHIEAVQRLSERLQLVGAVDPFAASLERVSQAFSLSSDVLFSSFEDALSRHVPDLVVVATTANLHHHYTLMAAQAGVRFVLCEKPMAVSLAQCDEMLEVCARTGTLLSINHPVRYTEADIEIKKLLASPGMGGLNTITISAGNYGLAMNASHGIEMLRFLAGEAPQTVQAWFDEDVVPNPRGPMFEDRSGQLRFVTPSGVVMNVIAPVSNGHGVVTVYGARHGQIVHNLLEGTTYVHQRREDVRDCPTTQYAMPSQSRKLDVASADLVTRCQRMMLAVIDGKDRDEAKAVRATIAALLAAYMSHEQGGVAIDVQSAAFDVNRQFPWA